MPKIDNKTFYSSAIEMYGITAKGVNWHSKESQNLRFEIILKMLPKEMGEYSVADAGCGFGDLYLYMQKKKRMPKEYIGIDALIDMYSIASERTGCEIVVADICKEELPSADFYICSGAMNVLNDFETHLFMQNCFNSCKVGFLFNVLYGDKESETYNYLTRAKIEKIAADLGASEVIFKDDYMQDDVTVMFKKSL
ncbi:MAG TPA: class I SAM-dependent methyltransferase [Sulfurimonas sp.]|uniref:class I SAM-dependent methyltransferase n=1 Tax=Sulfurimonas sp. TaxID=2022749 RepID=UPI002C446502|nr:class I SAM-dependent methyltransferase [Sulfurimonas sp.]HUH43009.1 class I SAM-dependent methyltransferase [Sulfurimonas sp.]